ncbi:MAG: ankyrin repeat domain-containing protein [Holophagales bacterium]|nr:ankyrin repeat domain-containing protein [Holophagales bacterium]
MPRGPQEAREALAARPARDLEQKLLAAALRGNLARFEQDFDSARHLHLVDEQGYTLLMLATDSGRRALVEYLLDAGADVNARLDDGTTALWIAVSAEYTPIVELLLERGAEVDAKADIDQITPLMLAVMQGHRKIAIRLLDAGASLEERDRNDWTAFDYAETGALRELLEAHRPP